MSREFYKELSSGTQNCQRTKNKLKLSKAGGPRITLGRKARITGREINSGATRLNNIIFNNREILGSHFVSSFNTFKGDIFVPFFTRGKDSIDKASQFSCQCTASSFFRFSSCSG